MRRNNFVLMGSSAMLGAMTAAERQKGRYMRAPDGHEAEFEEFAKAGDVEVGETNLASQKGEDEPAPKPKAKAVPAVEPDLESGEGEEAAEPGEGDETDEEEKPKPKKTQTPSERIRELSKRLRTEERLRLAADERLAALEKRVLPRDGDGGNYEDEIGDAPDPQDTDTYPLGHLDDRYLEDKLEWLATKKAAERADAVLQRQQENERNQTAQQQHKVLLEKVDDLATRGSEIADDFQETVVEAGVRGTWRLEQATFEAAHESDHGAQILYELSQDKAEAKRVAGLSPYQQMKFVMDRTAEIAKTKTPRKIPQAGDPPRTQSKGANSATKINPATDNLDDFEKAWEADAKGKR